MCQVLVAPCMRWATSETCWMSGRLSGLGLMQASTRRRSCVYGVCVCAGNTISFSFAVHCSMHKSAKNFH